MTNTVYRCKLSNCSPCDAAARTFKVHEAEVIVLFAFVHVYCTNGQVARDEC